MAKREQIQATQEIQPQRQADFFINVTSNASGKAERLGIFACYVETKDGAQNFLEQAILDYLKDGGNGNDILETLEFQNSLNPFEVREVLQDFQRKL